MTIDRRTFIKNMGLGIASAGAAAGGLISSASGAASGAAQFSSGSEALFTSGVGQPTPAPVGYDRLPLDWYQATTERLKAKLKPKGVDAILLVQDVHKVYYTGCFRNSGERTTWVLFKTNEKNTAYWYAPGIDRDLITSWWSTEFKYYFCYPHGEGGYPNLGNANAGPTVDLFEWLLEDLVEQGMAGKTIGTDMNLSPAQLAMAAKMLPGVKFINIGNDCLQMRIIKTPEEIALTQRAYRYFDKVHAFSRDYILERGTDATDFEIGQALQAYAIEMMMADVKYDGKPHSAVGVDSTSHYVRAGVATAYPHPNQYFYNKVQKGETLYVNTDLTLGGMGGEGYRNYLIAPWTPAQDKMWQVVAETVQIMVDETKPGVKCSHVAQKIHEHQIKNGMQDYIYHRPGHGTGMNGEGHQAPFVSLGDHTIIEEGMMFSVEPGLYDSHGGFGINPSDNLLVTATGSVLMTRIPYTKEWSYLKL